MNSANALLCFLISVSFFMCQLSVFATAAIRERAVSRGCPQGSCFGPGMWNVFYNSLLNLKFTGSTKIIASADDLLLLTRGETVSEIENIANLELTKISKWAREKKVRFNEKKSKTMLM